MAYLRRSVFFNATARTVQGMVGACFRRSPSIAGGAADQYLGDVTMTDESFEGLAKTAMRELLTVGRYGLLCDYSGEENRPYLVPYVAENIINWRTERIDGRSVVTMVVLSEMAHVEDVNDEYEQTASFRLRMAFISCGYMSR
jgi:hypothetical protein